MLWGDRLDREIVRRAGQSGSDLLAMARDGHGMMCRVPVDTAPRIRHAEPARP